MEHPALQAFERQQLKTDIPYFQPGDTVRVNTRVIEGDKERIQAFEGAVIARAGGGVGETFTVRKISFGTGVERTFLLNSPRIESIKVVRRGHFRRAKLYYLRDRVGKATRIKKRRKQLSEEFMNRMTALPEIAVPAPVEIDIALETTPDETKVEAAVAEEAPVVDETSSQEETVAAESAETSSLPEESATEETKQ